MKVAHIVGKLKTAGVESVVFTYLRNMPLEGIETDVIYDSDSTSKPPKDLVDAGINFIEVPPYQQLSSYIGTLKYIFKKNKYDIVHSHMNVLSVFSLWAAKKAKIRHRICHSHSMTSPKEKLRNALKLTLRPLSRLVATDYAACSELSGRWMFGDKNYDKGKVTLFYNAIDFEKYSYNIKNREKIRTQYGVGDSILLGHVGRFFETKNHPFMIDILVECKKRNIDAKLMLVGEGETQADIKEKAETLGVSDSVILVGLAKNTEEFYSAFDIFLLPSFYEGLPVVSMEAQASGLDCIISDVVTRECAIGDRVTYLPIDSPSVWADKIEAYCQRDRTTASVWFKNSKFSIKNSAVDMTDHYKKLMGDSPKDIGK